MSILLSPARLATLQSCVRQRKEPNFLAWTALEKAARDALGRSPHAPERWYVPGYYVDGPGHVLAKKGLAEDANAAYTLALAYAMEPAPEYAEAASRFLLAWSQRVKVLETADDSTLSFSYHFPALIFAASLLQGSAAWPAASARQFGRFVREKALPLNTMHRDNNWGNWGMVLVLASAAYLEDRELFARGVQRWKDFIAEQVDAEGALHHEVLRNQGVGDYGLWYSHFTLMPQTIAAEIARVQGVDLFNYTSPNGRSLRQAYATLVPWTLAPETFPYYTGGPAKKQQATGYASYWEILNARWPQPGASEFLRRGRPWTASHSAPHLTFTHGDLLEDELTV